MSFRLYSGKTLLHPNPLGCPLSSHVPLYPQSESCPGSLCSICVLKATPLGICSWQILLVLLSLWSFSLFLLTASLLLFGAL